MERKFEIILTPSGHLRVLENEEGGGDAVDRWLKRVSDSFSESQGLGLFALAATRPDIPCDSVFAFWRNFSICYLTRLCRMPQFKGDQLVSVEPPSESEVFSLLLSAPPMQGGEYLSPEILRGLWEKVDLWVQKEIEACEAGPGGWLKKHAPAWQQVGRVCFHLAENKRDPEFPFAFLATYAPTLSKRGQVQYQPLGKALQEYARESNRKALINLLSPVQRASEKVGFVQEMVDSADIYHPLAWTPSEAYRLLESVPQLEESGLLVRIPDWWRKRVRPRVAVTIGETKQNRFGADAIIDFSVRLALGDKELTDEEYRRILESEDGLVYVKGQWIEVDRDRLSEALEHWKRIEVEAEGGISFIEGMRLLAGAPSDLSDSEPLENEEGEWFFVGAGEWLSDVLSHLRDPGGLASNEISSNFRGSLRQYQEAGRNWLWFLLNLGLGACLADDMGLGKTVQVLALLLSLKEQDSTSKTSLLVLPASLISNWKAEMERFAPTLKAIYIHPSETTRNDLVEAAANPIEAVAGADIVFTTYGMLLRQEWLADIRWSLVVLDEAQAIKNPSTRQTKAVKRLKSDARIALTGTPIENRLSDLWSLFDFLCPGLLGSASKFKQFVKGIEERERDRYAPLRNLVSPYILRRLKTDKSIIDDLPDKTEMKVFCGLTKKQVKIYARSVDELATAINKLDGIKRRGLVLAYLMRFKQICNHPSQFIGDGAYDPAESGKFSRLKEICEEIASRQEKALIFTQFREMTGPIASFLGEVFSREGLVLHGGTAVKKRKGLIDLFQREEGPPFFVLSLKAGGTGLNLTSASHVIHFDRWWNPAVENQATDRAFRIGQHRNVVVHKFVCRGTVEEKIDALIDEKTSLADGILATGADAMLTEMSDDDLLRIVALDINRTVL